VTSLAARPIVRSQPLATLEGLVERARSLVERAQAQGFALGLEAFEPVELPPAITPATDQAHLQAIASLYLAAELEGADLLPAVEALAGLVMTAGLPLDLGEAADLVASFWSSRHERFSREERHALFLRLFGDPASPDGVGNPEFEPLFIDLCEALYRVAESQGGLVLGGPAEQVRVRMAASQVLDNLLSVSGGATAYVAGEVVHAVQAAVNIVKHRAVQRAFLARSPWDVVRRVSSQYLQEDPNVAAHVNRGKTGMQILSWVGDALPAIGAGAGNVLSPDAPVIAAAAEWLQASLSLRESQAQPAGASPGG
jgi:hypothetical protein